MTHSVCHNTNKCKVLLLAFIILTLSDCRLAQGAEVTVWSGVSRLHQNVHKTWMKVLRRENLEEEWHPAETLFDRVVCRHKPPFGTYEYMDRNPAIARRDIWRFLHQCQIRARSRDPKRLYSEAPNQAQ